MLCLPILAASLVTSPVASPTADESADPAMRPMPLVLATTGSLAPASFATQTGDFAQLAKDSGAAIDAGMADLILSTAAFIRPAPAKAAPAADRRWRLGPVLSAAGLADTPGGGLAGQTTQQIGSQDRLALAWRHDIDGSATLSNAFKLSHASGPIETQLAVIGRLSIAQGGPMALSYRSSTTLALLPFFSVGADAEGPLGSLSAIRPGLADSVVEPRLKLTVPLLGAEAGATTGWRVPTGPAASTEPDKRTEFHWRLTVRKKL